MAPAVIAYRMLCESTVQASESIRVPRAAGDDVTCEDGAVKLLSGKTSGNFLHRSVIFSMFYAALIMCGIRTAGASSADQQESLYGYNFEKIGRTLDEQDIVNGMTHEEWHETDAFYWQCCHSDGSEVRVDATTVYGLHTSSTPAMHS